MQPDPTDTPTPVFPSAAQPNLIRAQQKVRHLTLLSSAFSARRHRATAESPRSILDDAG
jgi:hypothetical protein